MNEYSLLLMKGLDIFLTEITRYELYEVEIIHMWQKHFTTLSKLRDVNGVLLGPPASFRAKLRRSEGEYAKKQYYYCLFDLHSRLRLFMCVVLSIV